MRDYGKFNYDYDAFRSEHCDFYFRRPDDGRPSGRVVAKPPRLHGNDDASGSDGSLDFDGELEEFLSDFWPAFWRGFYFVFLFGMFVTIWCNLFS